MKMVRLAAGVVVACAVGCGRSEPTIVTPPAPHGGTIVGLPDNLGNVEVVRAEGASAPGQAKLFLYFLDSGGKAMAPAPTSATLKPKGRGAAAVNFKPATGGEPTQVGALESGSFAVDGDVVGELTTRVANKAITVTLNVR